MTIGHSERSLPDLEPPAAADARLDVLGLFCPVPIVRTAETLRRLLPGQVLEVLSDDRVILIDMPAWCVSHGHQYLGAREDGSGWRLLVRHGGGGPR
jgi:TusA-related sulfurtransferase